MAGGGSAAGSQRAYSLGSCAMGQTDGRIELFQNAPPGREHNKKDVAQEPVSLLLRDAANNNLACFELVNLHLVFGFCAIHGKQSKVYGYSSSHSQSNLPHHYGNAHAIYDHTVLPANRQR